MGAFFNRFLMTAKRLVPSTGPVRNRAIEKARREFNEDAPARAEAKAEVESRETAKLAKLAAKAKKNVKVYPAVVAKTGVELEADRIKSKKELSDGTAVCSQESTEEGADAADGGNQG